MGSVSHISKKIGLTHVILMKFDMRLKSRILSKA